MMDFRDLLRRFGEEQPPQMRCDGDDSAESFTAWQKKFRAKLDELRGEPLERPEARVELLGMEELEDHVREHIAIDSVLGTKVAAYVLKPKGRTSEPRPGVLALHGHGKHGKEATCGVAPSEQGDLPRDYAVTAARAGLIALCPDWWGWGERVEPNFDFGGNDKCNTKFVAAAMYGIPLLSIMLSDGTAALDALAARPDVDASRIAVMGNSYGGRTSMYMAAFDTRIKAAVCAGCLNCFRERSLKLSSCGAQFFPGLLRWGDVEDIFCLIAPRPLMIMSGSRDPLLFADDRARMRKVVERAYGALGAADNVSFYDFDGDHYLPQGPAIQWLKQHFGVAEERENVGR